MKNFQKGFVNMWLVAVIVILLIALGYFAFVKKSDMTQQKVVSPTSEANSIANSPTSTIQGDNISTWKSYSYNGGSPYLSPAISFKYPSDWKVELGYYMTPGGSKDVTGIILTSPNGIDQINYGVGRQSELTCEGFKKMTEIPGKIECTEIKGVPFYLVYQNSGALSIYNQIVKTIK